MTSKTNRILAAFFVVLILHSGCSTVQRRPEVAKAAPVAKKQLVKTTQSWDGSLLPAYPQGQPEITILWITISPGARLDTHHHPVINAGVLISGQLTVITANGKTLYLNAGDPIVEVVNASHYGINQGTVPAEIIVFYAGITNAPVTVIEAR